ncbi:MAG TPA: HAD family hydrolase [Frateuria sp.]|uniref:HAD family hydrolase n=1 Tax=Frateuria sp. TaxID=2211372 RepID=UPI002D7E5DBC|nr:HAD family hydrolase [Frateuria sp.]HET6804901.1 HAD family hydrolase [Frateuria sp.]
MADLALFDFDGTITVRETMADFMYLAVPARRQAWGRLLLAPWVAGYRCGVVPGVAVRAAVVRVGLTGVPVATVQAHGVAFAAEALPALLRPEAVMRIRWHQARGDTVAVVSGGLDAYLAPWCRAHGLALVCSALEDRHGRLTGRYRGAQCVGEEKARRVRARYELARFGRVYAYGDTHEDLALLALAHHRFYRGQELPAHGERVSRPRPATR